jgi:hypothetical protein
MYLWQMNLTKHFLFYTFIFTVLVSCKNDLKLNAPYKEIPSIYAVLSGQEKAHVIRINKVFLGEGDANVMAKVADSVNYPAGELTVTLERFETGSNYKRPLDVAPAASNYGIGRRVITFKDSLVQTEPGSFSNTQRVYVAYEDFHDGAPGTSSYKVFGDYLLTVKNNRTGNVFKAKSSILDSVTPSNIKPFVVPYYPYAPGYDDSFSMDYSEQEKTYNVRFNTTAAQIYQVVVRMHFIDSLYPSNIYRYVDYVGNNLDLKDRVIPGNGSSSYFNPAFKGKDIFNAAAVGFSQLKLTDQVVGRRMYMIEYFVYASTQDFLDYMEFVKPSLNISQNKPLYSNFENRDALGIFTFRSRLSVKKRLSNNFLTEFRNNPATCKYQFYTADLSRKGCP